MTPLVLKGNSLLLLTFDQEVFLRFPSEQSASLLRFSNKFFCSSDTARMRWRLFGEQGKVTEFQVQLQLKSETYLINN